MKGKSIYKFYSNNEFAAVALQQGYIRFPYPTVIIRPTITGEKIWCENKAKLKKTIHYLNSAAATGRACRKGGSYRLNTNGD